MARSVVFRVVGNRQVLAATSAAGMTQAILRALPARRPLTITLQIGISTDSVASGLDWGDLGMIPGLERWRVVRVGELLRVRDDLWAAMLEARAKWDQNERMVAAFAGAVAAPGPLRVAGAPVEARSYTWRGGDWIEETVTVPHPLRPEK